MRAIFFQRHNNSGDAKEVSPLLKRGLPDIGPLFSSLRATPRSEVVNLNAKINVKFLNDFR
jgi:hypothetical protein